MKKLWVLVLAFGLVAACGGDPTMMTPTDMTMPGTGAFGAACTVDGDCQSNLCRSFQMMTIKRCTKACTPATAAADCPNPPSGGTCTNNNYCRFEQ
jgi:hypothetical protein